VLCPHFIVFAVSTDPSDAAAAASESSRETSRLAVGAARTRDFAPEEIGRSVMAHATREAVERACAAANIPLTELCFAQIKCPLLTPERVAAAAAPCATEDCYRSMALSRGAASLGVALATGEVASVCHWLRRADLKLPGAWKFVIVQRRFSRRFGLINRHGLSLGAEPFQK
jgi:cyanuric acid amidohydrolase